MIASLASTYVATITAFDADGRFDPDQQRRHFRRMADAGLSAVVGSSGAGEGYTLSEPEWREFLQIGREELKGRVRFDLMGLEARSAQHVIDHYRLALEYDIDGVHIYGLEVGHGSRPDEREFEAYLRDILDVIDLPSYLVNQPGMIGYGLPVAMVARLAKDYPQVIGVLDTSRDLKYLGALADELGDRLELVTIIDQALAVLAVGGHGFSCGEANVVPELCASLVTHFAEGDHRRAVEDYRLLMAVNRVITSLVPASSRVHTYKAALRELGLPGGGGMRAPRRWISESDQRRLGDALRALEVPELLAAAQ